MNTLREQLQQAQATHLAQHYPGDLARELLPIPHPRPIIPMRYWYAAAFGSLAASIAILIALAVVFSRPRSSTESVPLAPVIAQNPPADFTLPAMPEMPSDAPLVPEYQLLSLPSMPSFPSSVEADASQQEGPTTQETIL